MSPPASWPSGSHPGEALSALADDELAAGERLAVAAHVERCPECAEELRAVRAVRDAVRALPPVEPPPAFLDRLVAGAASPAVSRRRPAPGVTVMAAAAVVALAVLAPAVAGLGRHRPEVDRALLRHVASMSAMSAVGSTTADGGPSPLVPPALVTPATMPPLDVDDLPAPYRAVPELVGGYRLVGAFSHPDGLQLVYEDGRYGLSVFEAPGELDAAGLRAGGEPVEGDAEGWRWQADGLAGRVVVLEQDGMVLTAVGDEPGDAVLSAARSIPAARDLSLGQRLRRAAAQVLRGLSPSSGPPLPGAA